MWSLIVVKYLSEVDSMLRCEMLVVGERQLKLWQSRKISHPEISYIRLLTSINKQPILDLYNLINQAVMSGTSQRS